MVPAHCDTNNFRIISELTFNALFPLAAPGNTVAARCIIRGRTRSMKELAALIIVNAPVTLLHVIAEPSAVIKKRVSVLIIINNKCNGAFVHLQILRSLNQRFNFIDAVVGITAAALVAIIIKIA